MTPDEAFLKVEEQEHLLGDSRDRVMSVIWHRVDRKNVSEHDQRMLISAVEQVCRENIRAIAQITAGRNYPAYEVQVSGLTQKIKGEVPIVEAKLTADDTNENVLGLLRAGRCLLVKVDLKDFMGERAPAEVLLDAPELPIEEVDADTGLVRENTERLEAGITQLEVEGEAGLPAHDPETGEVLEEAARADTAELLPAEPEAGSAFGWDSEAQQQKPKRGRKAAAAAETEAV